MQIVLSELQSVVAEDIVHYSKEFRIYRLTPNLTYQDREFACTSRCCQDQTAAEQLSALSIPKISFFQGTYFILNLQKSGRSTVC